MAEVAELTSSVPANWSSFLDQIRKEYETPPAKGIAHGLQKDAIQNGWGARDGKKKWKFEFALIEPPGRSALLTMTDSGTTGLTGALYDATSLPDQIPPDQRLARFESMFDSGDLAVGQGLYGRGKLIFSAASAERLIYYDSLTREGTYRFGMRRIKGREYQQFRRIFEGASAIEELERRLGGIPQPLAHAGTRITITNPLPEVVEAIKTDAFLEAIEETWWEIILKHSAEITVRVGAAPAAQARVPADFGSLPTKNEKGWRVYCRENEAVAVSNRSYRIKKLHFLVAPAGRSIRLDLRGVSVHRRGMKVGPIQLAGVPREIEERLFGYVQLEPDYEELLAKHHEDVVHYGFGSLHKAPFRNLKKAVVSHFDHFLEQLGFKKGEGDPEEQTRKLIEEAQADLNSILHDMGMPGFGAGREPSADLLVSVEDLQFPGDSNYLRTGDRIAGFWFRVENGSAEAKSAWLEVRTYERDVGVIEVLHSRRRLDLPGSGVHETEPLAIEIISSRYPRFKKVGCVCQLTDAEKRVLAKRAFFFFIDLEPPAAEEEHAQIQLKSADWPRPASRRVDYGQSVRNLRYEFESLSPVPIAARVRLRTLWAAGGNSPIAEIGEGWDVRLGAFQSQIIHVPEVAVTPEAYQEVQRGKINLRCHAAATEKTRFWEKGERLAEETVAFFLNEDPSYGFFEEPEYFQGGPEDSRSQALPVEASRRWKFRLNTTHPAFAAAGDPVRRKDYLFEEMAKQTVYVLLRTGQYEPLRKHAGLGSDVVVEKLEPEDVLNLIGFKIADKILAEYYSG